MKRFKNILYIIDSDFRNREAFKRAVNLAENNQASLTIVTLLDEAPDYHPVIQGISFSEIDKPVKKTLLDKLKKLASSCPNTIPISVKILTGKPFIAIIREVLIHQRDLVIKTADREHFLDHFLGSLDMHLLRKCPCPVWLVKPSQQGQYRKILASVDFDPLQPKDEDNTLNGQIMQMSLSLALSEFSEWHLVHVWSAYGESSLRTGLIQEPAADVDAYVDEIRHKHQQALDELLSQYQVDSENEMSRYIQPKIHMLKGNASDKIPELVKKERIELIVMGTVGRTGLPGFFMGNTSETILGRINCSVLAVKPEGFVSPVRV